MLSEVTSISVNTVLSRAFDLIAFVTAQIGGSTAVRGLNAAFKMVVEASEAAISPGISTIRSILNFQARQADARDRVFGTAELLELILLELPSRDLLLAQRVCWRWKQVIDVSDLLQRHLFLVPVPCGAVSWLDWRFDDKNMYPVSLGEPLRLRQANGRLRYRAHWGQSRSDNGKFRVFINPMLENFFPILSTDKVKAGASVFMHGKGMENREASWRRMLITQPPIGTMFLEWDHESDAFHHHRDKGWSVYPMSKSSGSTGITASHLVETMPRSATNLVWIEGSEEWERFEGQPSLRSIKQVEKSQFATGAAVELTVFEREE